MSDTGETSLAMLLTGANEDTADAIASGRPADDLRCPGGWTWPRFASGRGQHRRVEG